MIVLKLIIIDKPKKVVHTHNRCKRISNFQFNKKRHDFSTKRFGKKAFQSQTSEAATKRLKFSSLQWIVSKVTSYSKWTRISLNTHIFSHTSRLCGMHYAKEYHFCKNNFKSLSDISFQEKRFKNSEMVLSCIVHATQSIWSFLK